MNNDTDNEKLAFRDVIKALTFGGNRFRGKLTETAFAKLPDDCSLVEFVFPLDPVVLKQATEKWISQGVAVSVGENSVTFGTSQQFQIMGGVAHNPRLHYQRFIPRIIIWMARADRKNLANPQVLATHWNHANTTAYLKPDDIVMASESDFLGQTFKEGAYRVFAGWLPSPVHRMETYGFAVVYNLLRANWESSGWIYVLQSGEKSDGNIGTKFGLISFNLEESPDWQWKWLGPVDLGTKGTIDRAPEMSFGQFTEHIRKALSDNPPLKDPFIGTFGKIMGTGVPVLHRDEEIDQLAQVLLMRSGNIALITGWPGVGKTVVVEGYAQKCIARDPMSRTVRIDASSFSHLDSMQPREVVLGIMREAYKHKKTTLYFREMFSLLDRTVVFSESIKLFHLLRTKGGFSKLRICLEATERQMERLKDQFPELPVYFEQIWISEPAGERLRDVVSQSSKALAEHHGVRFDESAIAQAILLSDAYHKSDRQPMKAIQLLDRTAAYFRWVGGQVKDTPIVDGNMILKMAQVAYQMRKSAAVQVSLEEIAKLEQNLSKRVFDQDKAVSKVAAAVRTAKAGLIDERRPIGIFLFVGPSGSGKTELAKALCELLYGEEKNLVRFDMSEFQEWNSLTKLIGAPPGYLGHENGGQLTNAFFENPNRIVLFDEIEKANPTISDLFLQLFDDGRLTDAKGRTADFSNSVIILTSNLGLRKIEDRRRKGTLGFSSSSKKNSLLDISVIEKELRAFFRPELLNRINEIIYFDYLTTGTVRRIIGRQIQKLNSRLVERGLEISLTPESYDKLMELGFSETTGARGMENCFKQTITDPLATLLLEQRFHSGNKVVLDCTGSELTFKLA